MDDVKGLVKGVVKGVAKGASQLGQGIVLNMDTAKLNSIVSTYNRRVDALVPQLDALMAPLDEAYRSAPKFEAQEARAQGFGMRALEEFKGSQVWLKVDSAGKDDLNLAANEYLENGHTLDKTSERRTSSWRSACATSRRTDPPRRGRTVSRTPVVLLLSRTTGGRNN